MVRLAFGRAAKVVFALIIAAVATMPAQAVEGAPGADTVTLALGPEYNNHSARFHRI